VSFTFPKRKKAQKPARFRSFRSGKKHPDPEGVKNLKSRGSHLLQGNSRETNELGRRGQIWKIHALKGVSLALSPKKRQGPRPHREEDGA